MEPMTGLPLGLILVGLLLLAALTMDNRPLGCPRCGAPDPAYTGWTRCPECGQTWWKERD